MQDVYGVPVTDNKVFYGRGTTNWQVWEKPLDVQFISITCVGGGAGGGPGQTGAIGAARGGGGGGGSGAVGRYLFAATLLPDLLYMLPGVGGASGVAGMKSFVSVVPDTTLPNNILAVSGASAATMGQSGSVGGSAGIRESVATMTSAYLAALGVPTWTFGLAAQSGANSAAGNAVSAFLTGIATCGGAGGAGCQSTVFAGGAVIGAGPIPVTVPGGAGGTPGADGPSGMGLWAPFASMGGAGGGSSDSGAGGAGGNGWYGSGGGGGGSGVTGGLGGRGGNGLVIVEAW